MERPKKTERPIRPRRYDPPHDPSLTEPATIARDLLRLARNPADTREKVFQFLMWKTLSLSELEEVYYGNQKYLKRIEREISRRRRRA